MSSLNAVVIFSLLLPDLKFFSDCVCCNVNLTLNLTFTKASKNDANNAVRLWQGPSAHLYTHYLLHHHITEPESGALTYNTTEIIRVLPSLFSPPIVWPLTVLLIYSLGKLSIWKEKEWYLFFKKRKKKQ